MLPESLLRWSSLRISSAIGVPVVLPSNTPDSISTVSDSRRCVTWREVPGLRRSRSCWMSASHNANPGGQPSTTQPSAAPCDSPNDVTVNKVPSVFPDIALSRQNNSVQFNIWRLNPSRPPLVRGGAGSLPDKGGFGWVKMPKDSCDSQYHREHTMKAILMTSAGSPYVLAMYD